MDDLTVTIMAGGAGIRFWPVSTGEKPKQFLALTGERSLLQQSHDRVRDLVPPERILVLTQARFRDLVAEQLPDLPEANLLCEPCRRDTAAAITLGAEVLARRHGDPVMAVLPSDHVIEPDRAFHDALLSAARAARGTPALYTFGIPPTRPETAYGYLERGEALVEDPDLPHYRLASFREKPDAATAAIYAASGRHFWNSGIFVWQVSTLLDQVRTWLPDTASALAEAAAALDGPDGEDALARAFEDLTPISIDHGVMEKAPDVRMVAAPFAWSDLGGWAALAERLPVLDDGNRARGDLLHHDSRDNIVFCSDESERVVLIGVNDLVVVRAGGHTLVVPRDRAEEIKKLTDEIS